MSTSVCVGANSFMVVGVWPRGFDGYAQWERFHFQTDVSHKQFCIVARFLFCSLRLLLKSGLYVYARRLRLLAAKKYPPPASFEDQLDASNRPHLKLKLGRGVRMCSPRCRHCASLKRFPAGSILEIWYDYRYPYHRRCVQTAREVFRSPVRRCVTFSTPGFGELGTPKGS